MIVDKSIIEILLSMSYRLKLEAIPAPNYRYQLYIIYLLKQNITIRRMTCPNLPSAKKII